MNNFYDALLGGFQSPLNNGPVWSSVILRYQVSLTDPYINDFLNAYIQFYGFDVATQSQIAQLHASICLRFVSTSMPTLNPKFKNRALKEGVIVGPGNTAPLQIGVCECTLPDEWNNNYVPLSQKYPQLNTLKTPQHLTLIQHPDGTSGLKLSSPTVTRSMSVVNASPLSRGKDPTSSSYLSVPRHMPAIPRRMTQRSQSHKFADCQFCVPSASFQTEEPHSPKNDSQVFIPDIKSFSLPRAQSEISAKISDRHLEHGNTRRTFSNGTKKADLQWLSMKDMSDSDQTKSAKLHNYTNYQIVCMLQNIDDIARDVLELKEHTKKLHSGYNEMLGIKNEHTQQLNDINSNMGIISKSIGHLRDALPVPTSPPHYREVDLSSSKLTFTSCEPESSHKSILFKGVENISKLQIERIQKGIDLAKEKTELMKNRLKGFPSLDSLRLPKQYVSLKSLIENGQPFGPKEILAMSGESSFKRDRHEPYFFSHKGRKDQEDTSAHEASTSSPFGKYSERLQTTPTNLDNPSGKGYGNTLLVNIDCLSNEEVINVLHNIHAWALQRKAETKASWPDIVTQIVWSFAGIAKMWWDKLSDRDMTQIVENEDDPLKALFDALKHEFVGCVPEYSAHHAQLFLSQKPCDIDYLQEYFCTMQKLFYQAPDSHNVAYLRYYIASMPGKIPDLINQYIETNKINIENWSFVAIHQMIVSILQKECAAEKAKKNFKKQMHFSTKLCNTFPETYNFGCQSKSKSKALKKSKATCSCKSDKYFPKKKKYYPSRKTFSKRRLVFRKRSKPSKKVTCFICGKEGHYANNCREKKDKKQMKIMDIFSTIHDPKEWDLISHSEGEYFEVSSSSSSDVEEGIPDIRRIDLDDSSSDSEETFILDIKMFYSSSDNLQTNIATVKAELAQLDPVQFTARRRLAEKLESLEKQLPSGKRNKEKFTDEELIEKEFDSLFMPLQIKENSSLDSSMDKISSLKNRIGQFESSIHHTRSEMIQLSSKLQMLISDYDDCNSKLSSLLLKNVSEEFPQKDASIEEVKVMGIGDRVVIPIKIKLPKIKEYTLDVQIDSGAMSSCCKYGAIPSYYW